MDAGYDTGLGEVMISTDVIEKCAGASAVECFGVVGMASKNMRDGLAKLLKNTGTIKSHMIARTVIIPVPNTISFL